MISRPVELFTDRLWMKTLDVSHAESVLKYYLSNRQFLTPWIPYDASIYTLEHHVSRLSTPTDNGIKFYVGYNDEPERVIGIIGISNIVQGAFLSCNLGFGLDREEINKGVITEALNVVIAFVFESLKLHRIEANVMPNNKRSKRVMEKLNFTNEGLSKSYLKINGKWEDHERFVIWNEAVV